MQFPWYPDTWEGCRFVFHGYWLWSRTLTTFGYLRSIVFCAILSQNIYSAQSFSLGFFWQSGFNLRIPFFSSIQDFYKNINWFFLVVCNIPKSAPFLSWWILSPIRSPGCHYRGIGEASLCVCLLTVTVHPKGGFGGLVPHYLVTRNSYEARRGVYERAPARVSAHIE